MELPMRWRNVAFWAKTLLDEDNGEWLGRCRICQADTRKGEPHVLPCSRGRLRAALDEIEADLPE
jgi:hypothetical protein